MEEYLKYRYWMNCIQGIGNKKRQKLVEYCGSAKEVYRLTKRQLCQIEGIYESDADAIAASRQSFDLEKEVEILSKRQISMVTTEEEAFPEKLKYISDCPYALFYKGTLPLKEEKTAAIVGARLCSSYGRAAALELGEKLASHGIGIISGMAAGIDSFGHWGAIRGGGKTYAVLGCGVDVCYPKGGRELYERILTQGAVLSEYLPQTPPAPARFPARNRLISALADVVIVVEAKRKSGSLITADFALEQGKDIYAVPGRWEDTLSEGCNSLIRQGGGIITSSESLLLDLGISPKKNSADSKITKNSLEKEESLVYSCFDLQPKSMEELVKMTKIPASELADLLVKLQMKGCIEEYYKNYYRKK